jgi:hypothetical protein
MLVPLLQFIYFMFYIYKMICVTLSVLKHLMLLFKENCLMYYHNIYEQDTLQYYKIQILSLVNL